MVRKKAAIAIILATVVCITGILVPTMFIAANSDSPTITRLYSDSMAGPWSSSASISTKWIQKSTMVNGQTVIIIQRVRFIREEATGALVFLAGAKGNTGPQGLPGPQGPEGAEINFK